MNASQIMPRQLLTHFFFARLTLSSALALLSLLVILLWGICERASCQISGRGTIQGTVTDQSGAIIPGAQVRLIEVRTNQESQQTSTGAGFYSFGGLQPGLYSATVAAPGFQTYAQKNIPLDALQTFGLNIRMRVGGAETTVTVTDAPAPLNTANATLGSTMETETYKALPLIMGGQPRDPTAFIYFTPGVTGGAGVNQMNGGQSNLNETYIDGVAMNDVNQQSDWAPVHSTFSVDAVDQFQVQTSGVSAAYQGQGFQNFTHKSGTNAYHGSAFEYFRNTALDTWGFYGPNFIPTGSTKPIKPAEHQNEFGGTFGGHVPYFKDKIFFFASYDNDHYIHGNYGFITIPTLLQQKGDFSDLGATGQGIYDPNTTTVCAAHNTGGAPCRYQFGYGPGPGVGANGNPVLTGTPNVIPASRLSPISLYMAKFLPTPTNNNLTNNYFGGFNTGFNYPRQSYKLDFDVIKNHAITLLFLEGGRYPNPVCCDGSGLPRPYLTTVGNTQNNLTAMISDTWTINPRTVNKLSYTFTAGGFHGVGNTNPGSGDPAWYPAAAGITNVPPGQASDSFPSTSFAGPNAPLGWTTNDRASHGDVVVFHLQDAIQFIKGKHSISIGGEYQWEDSNSIALDTGTYLSLSYSNNETACYGNTRGASQCLGGSSLNTSQGSSYASFLIGALDSISVTDQRPVLEINARYHNFSPYVQDDIKVSQRLTVNAGLRWDLFSPWSEKVGRFSFVNLQLPNPVTGLSGALQFGGNGPSPTYCNCTQPIQIWYKNFGPRLGFAYSLDQKSVLRGSYGIYYSHAGGVGGRAGATAGTGQLGYSGGITVSSSNGGITPGYYLDGTNNAAPNFSLPPFIDPANGTGFTTNPLYSSNSPSGVTYADPYLSRRAPYYQNFNFGFQRELYKQAVLNFDYSGSIGHFLGTGVGRGIYSNQLDPKYYVLAGLLSAPASPSNVAAAQAIVPTFKLPFANFSPTATIAQALRPFPQFGAFNDIWGDVGNSNYNSLQIQLKQNFRHGLNYSVSYTWSKSLDDTGGSRSAYGVNGVPSSYVEYGLSGTDIPNHLAIYGIYNEGFGKSGGFWLTNQLIKDWSISTIFTYLSGTPITITGAGCNTPNAGTCYPNLNPNFTGPARINGGYGRANLANSNKPYLDVNAFLAPAPYTFGNAPRSYTLGLRNPGAYSDDLSIRRSFGIYERLKFTFEGSFFNVDNHTDFRGPATAWSSNSTSFGVVSAQANASRTAQFSGRFDF